MNSCLIRTGGDKVNRTEIEIKLNNDRVWLLEQYSALSAQDLSRPITTSKHDGAAQWSAKDHLVHLSGIERAFNRMVRRYLEGDPNPVGLSARADGSAPTREELLQAFKATTEEALRKREEIMARVHAMNEEWVAKHRDKSYDEAVALGQKVRAETLELLASLTDEQLQQELPGAPWGDGTIGGVMAINGDHGRRHYDSVSAGLAR
jgi:hypothetical protein